MCEATGEDLQWLLTGVAARSTVVISGTRSRHQELLTKLARLLDERPEHAARVEAFVDLLFRGEQAQKEIARQLPLPPLGDLIPIFEATELPLALPEVGDDGSGDGFPLIVRGDGSQVARREPARLAEPASDYEASAFRPVELVSLATDDGGTPRQFVLSKDIADCFPGAFGVRLHDDAMSPMFRAGDAVLVAVGTKPKVGHPVLCRVKDDPAVRCRVWLGEKDGATRLGRLADGDLEHVAAASVCWSLEVLYRLTAAA